MNRGWIVWAVAVLATRGVAVAAAETPAGLEERVAALEARSAGTEAPANVVSEWPVRISGAVTGVVQGMTTARDTIESDPVDFAFRADLFFESPVGEKGRVFLHLRGGDGTGITDELTTVAGTTGTHNGVNGLVNNSGANLQVVQGGYEHVFGDDFFTLTVGKLDVGDYFDANEYANDEASQFLSDALVNARAVPWPAFTGGIRGQIRFTPNVSLQAGYFEAGADFEDIDDSAFIITELGLSGELLGGKGNLRLGYWWESLKRPTWNNTAWSAPQGWTVSADWGRDVTFLSNQPGHLGIFGRYAARDDNATDAADPVNWQYDRSWSAGVSMTGLLPGRAPDVLGFAVAQAIPGRMYLDNGIGGAGNRSFYKQESLWELYYRIAFNDQVALTPHVQVLDNRLGDSRNEDVTIFGTRLELTF